MAPSNSSLSYRRIRAPQHHGGLLHLPERQHWQSVWQKNLLLEDQGVTVDSIPLAQLRQSARAEIVELASRFTGQYRDVNLDGRDTDQILMAGHQPTLFHAGVWYKNFVLSNLAAELNCIPINLVVDNDLCHSTFVNVPGPEQNFQRIYFDQRGPVVPYELRAIADRSTFTLFAKNAADAVADYVKQPIVESMWPYVLENHSDALGLAIAKGRHRFEADLGLQTLELPISAVAQTESFFLLFREIVCRVEDFQAIYNSTVVAYRAAHGIKNAFHPVPELTTDDGWCEIPYWIWTAAAPRRKSLFVRRSAGRLEISDRERITRQFSDSISASELAAEFGTELCVRPKALTTTLYSRLIASDMFIHGIGGSKYDQLTDEIARRFFGVELPGYLTISGTFKIQTLVPPVSDDQISNLRNRLRRITYHPESFIGSPDAEAQRLIEEKRGWVGQQLPKGQRLERHQAIVRLNAELQTHVGTVQAKLSQEIDELTLLQPQAKLLNSREYSFCLHDQNLPELLKKQEKVSE